MITGLLNSAENTRVIINMQKIDKTYCENIRAGSIINKNSVTEIIDVRQLAESTTLLPEPVRIIESNGKLLCTDTRLSPSSWIKNIKLSFDCQTTNVQLSHDSRGLYLQATRLIYPDEILFMWFSESILTMMEIPSYLNPFNIIDKNRYLCLNCKSVYEYPNVLKIHTALDCDRLSMSQLWRNMSHKFDKNQTNSVEQLIPVFKFELSGSPPMTPERLATPLDIQTSSSSSSSSSSSVASPSSSSSSSRSSPGLSPAPTNSYPPSAKELNRSSAFKLYTKNQYSYKPETLNQQYSTYHSQDNQSIRPIQYNNCYPQNYNNYHQELPGISASVRGNPSMSCQQHRESSSVPALPLHHRSVLPGVGALDSTHAEHIETIFSNIGKSNDGHRCVYCGKVYSRKYGLKIHLRTHTGFKPLKCKYCLRPFGDPSNLNKHVRLHTEGGGTPYKCSICSKVLVRRRDLERHMKTRHNHDNSTGNITENESEIEV